MSDWQPIETASAVGKKRLLFWAGKGMAVVGFRIAGTNRIYASGIGRLPASHWMPLPTPPEPKP